MIRVGSFASRDFKRKKDALIAYFQDSVMKGSGLPAMLTDQIYPKEFLSSSQYLIFPLFFRNCFGAFRTLELNRLCSAGYLYFKYLLCVDTLLDKDVAEAHENAVPDSVLQLRSHVYHEQGLRRLADLFPPDNGFWTVWEQRGKEFLESILLDKKYRPDMELETYAKLSQGKCAFLKAAADSFFFRASQKDAKCYAAILRSLDLLAVGRCLQDDFEDFKKDLIHKKNNYGHVLLRQWFEGNDKRFDEQSPVMLEKYFYTSLVAEKLLEKSKQYFNEAIEAVSRYAHLMPEYIRHLESFRNKSNLIKVNIEAYRITKLTQKLKADTLETPLALDEAVARSLSYIHSMQNGDGSWHEITNKQGLSNVWSTAFIAMNLEPASPEFRKAADYLFHNRQNGLWGYNRDWVSDFDSTTCALLVLQKAGLAIREPLRKWMKGQHRTGGFATYASHNTELASYMGFHSTALLKDWSRPHVCVSALAYYLLSDLPDTEATLAARAQLRPYMLRAANERQVWEPYWWSSFIYPTVFTIKALLKEGDAADTSLIDASVRHLVSRQSKDGGFKCDVLKSGSVFYTALVLELLCQSDAHFTRYRNRIERMKNWLLAQQHDNGAFESADFLLIPMSDGSRLRNRQYRLNRAGGTGSITGEIGGLFSTAVAHKALHDYQRRLNGLHHG